MEVEESVKNMKSKNPSAPSISGGEEGGSPYNNLTPDKNCADCIVHFNVRYFDVECLKTAGLTLVN